MAYTPTIYVVYYSLYGHIATLAKSIVEGVQKSGCNTKLFQIAETLSPEVLAKMHAAPKDPNVPVLTPNELTKADGVLFGIPTRYGNSPAQWRAFWDRTGGLWVKQAFQGKLAGMFFSTGSQHGGQETTAFTNVTTLAHHGMIFVPLGFSTPLLQDNSEVIGGSAYGAGTVAGGDGSRQVSDKEKQIAVHQGDMFGKTVYQHFNGVQKSN